MLWLAHVSLTFAKAPNVPSQRVACSPINDTGSPAPLLNCCITGLHAVLFLLLVSGETLKWAELTADQLNGIGILQLILTCCVGFSIAVWMMMNPRKVYKSITVRLAVKTSEQRGRAGMQGWHLHVHCCYLHLTATPAAMHCITVSAKPMQVHCGVHLQNKVDTAKKMYESASNVALRASNAAVRASAAAGRLSGRVSARTSSAVGSLSRTASGRARALSVRVSTAMRRTGSTRRVAAEESGHHVEDGMAMPPGDSMAVPPSDHLDSNAGNDDVFTARLKVQALQSLHCVTDVLQKSEHVCCCSHASTA